MSMVHVIPLNDEKDHEYSTTCDCSPHVDWNDPETGEAFASPMVIHNAFDCRELIEQVQGNVGEPGKKWLVELVD